MHNVAVIARLNRRGPAPSLLSRHNRREGELIKKAARIHTFPSDDRFAHKKYGQGADPDTIPAENEKFLYALFDNGDSIRTESASLPAS